MKIDDLEDRILSNPLFGFSSAMLIFTIMSYAFFGDECIVIDFRQKDNLKIYSQNLGEKNYQPYSMKYDSTLIP